MEIEGIYLHGGVKGFSFINDSGTQAESDSFFRRFYDRITKAAISVQKIDSISKSFIIESLQKDGKQFYDYTFMEHYIYDVSGRPSYLGITIRLSAFYCELSDLYFILDTVFKKNVIGNLLLPKEATYMCTKEQIDKSLFEKVMTDIVQLSSFVLQDSNLRNIRSASGGKENGININPIDCHPKIVEKAITKYGRVNISADAPLQRETQNQQELDKLNQQWTAKWNDFQEKYAAAVKNVQGLNGTIQTLQGQLSQAQNNLLQVQKEYEDYKSKNKLSYDIINGLKEEKQALLKLAGFVDSLGIEQLKAHSNRRNNNDRNKQDENDDILRFNIKPYLYYIIPAIALALIAWFLLSLKDCSDKEFLSFIEEGETPVEVVVEHPQKEPSTEIDTTKGQIAERISEGEDNFKSGEINKTVNIDYNSLTIDVAEFTKDIKYMTKNGAYTIRICDKIKFKPVEGIKGNWKIQDSDFYIGNTNSSETTITPIRSGNDLELQFFVDGYGTPLKRTIVVK